MPPTGQGRGVGGDPTPLEFYPSHSGLRWGESGGGGWREGRKQSCHLFCCQIVLCVMKAGHLATLSRMPQDLKMCNARKSKKTVKKIEEKFKFRVNSFHVSQDVPFTAGENWKKMLHNETSSSDIQQQPQHAPATCAQHAPAYIRWPGWILVVPGMGITVTPNCCSQGGLPTEGYSLQRTQGCSRSLDLKFEFNLKIAPPPRNAGKTGRGYSDPPPPPKMGWG